MSPNIDIENRGHLTVLRLRHAPVNALSAPLRSALLQSLQQLSEDLQVRGVVIMGDGRCFSAGADINEFQQDNPDAITAGCDPAAITELIDTMSKPVLAALHGVALGGGLELALGCHYRVAAPGTQLGLPEIQLGLLPGAGGTQRLPRLIGLPAAQEMILSGRAIDATKALSLGLIDAIVEDKLVEGATRYLDTILARAAPTRRTRDRTLSATDIPRDSLERARTEARSKRALSFAAERIIDCLDASRLPFEAGMRFEREQFLACNVSRAAKALQYGFFAQREATKVPHIPAGTRERVINQVSIVGGGTMGRGIAMAFANADYPVTVIETDAARADAAAKAIRADYERLAALGRLTQEQAEARAARVVASTQDETLRTSDLVIEAVFEDLAIKTELCQRLGRLCKPGAIIASNTSALDINLLARASGRPADFLGLHFFSPAQVMRLLEIVRGEQTAPAVLATALALARRLEKHAVVCGVCFGFIGNRMLEPYLREAEVLLLEGATPRQIDRALEAFGMAMGPCRMLDLAGVDVAANVVIEQEKQGSLPADPTYRIVCRELYRLGRFGQKAGRGFYRYEGRKALDDLEAVAAIRELARCNRVTPRAAISDVEIVERCLLPLINEGYRIIEEGIAYRTSDLDVVWLSGYGFPADVGGPMFYASQMGLPRVRERLLHYASLRGDQYGYWTPAAALNNTSITHNAGTGRNEASS
jgi:3-hydroxyacyl-CoA dehydrogenase